MALKDELGDPWGLLLAAVVGGCAWAVGVPGGSAVAVGLAALGVKAATGTAIGGRGRGGRPGRAPSAKIRANSPENRWLARAEKAVGSFQRLAASAQDGPVADRCRAMGEQAEATIETMRRLAGQTSAVAAALDHVDASRLAAEEGQLKARLAQATPEVAAELQRSLESVQSQMGVHGRLVHAGGALLARMESGTIGLEGLVARLAEITAMAAASDPGTAGAGDVDALADELDGLRAGLAETEDLSRKALTAYRQAG